MKNKNTLRILMGLFVLFAADIHAQWIQQSSNTNCYFRSICSNGSTLLAVGNQGVIAKSSNSGTSWSCNPNSSISTFNNVCKGVNNTYYILGNANYILRTADPYTSYDTIPLPLPGFNSNDSTARSYQLNELCFADPLHGFIVGLVYETSSAMHKGIMLRSSDGGSSWTLSSTNYDPLNAIEFVNSTTGFMVGENGTVLKTTDGGNTWNVKTSGVTNSLRDVDFVNATTGYAVGGNGGALIISTANGGDSWTTLSTSCPYYLASVAFEDASKGYAVGGRGAVLSTQNGGRSWTIENTNVTLDLNAISILDGKIVVVGENGLILMKER